MFLADSDLERICGYLTSKAKIDWLRHNSIKHVVNSNGEPVVTKAEMERRLQSDPKLDKVIPTRTEILKRKVGQTLPLHGTYVYLLMLKREVVYVGQTRNLFLRIAAHQGSEKEFDKVHFVPIDADRLLTVEGELIAKFKPKYNVIGGPAERKIPVRKISEVIDFIEPEKPHIANRMISASTDFNYIIQSLTEL